MLQCLPNLQTLHIMLLLELTESFSLVICIGLLGSLRAIGHIVLVRFGGARWFGWEMLIHYHFFLDHAFTTLEELMAGLLL